MAYLCPVCESKSISYCGKLFALKRYPVKCKVCGSRLAISNNVSVIANFIVSLAVLPALYLTINYRSWLPMIIYIGGIFLFILAMPVFFKLEIVENQRRNKQ